MDFVKTIFASKYGDGAVALNGSLFDTLLGKSLGGDTPAPVMPSKGDIIAVDMDGDGTAENYLVLKEVGEGVYELLARASIGSGVFGSGTVYENNTLDVALNTTYYATLSETAKAAIIDKVLKQDAWYIGNQGSPMYKGTFVAGSTKRSYAVSLGNASFGNEISRHIYALSVQDIIDYLDVTTDMTWEDSTLNTANVQEVFGSVGLVALRTTNAANGGGNNVLVIYTPFGNVDTTPPSSALYYRPAFQLDLTKIEWTPVG